jgi:hypothetical protein
MIDLLHYALAAALLVYLMGAFVYWFVVPVPVKRRRS